MSGFRTIAEIVWEGEQIKEDLKKEVVGQDAAVEEVVNAIVSSELFDDESREKPKGTFLFAGTPGVGKTYLATRLAKHLECESLVLNMSGYNMRESSMLALFGEDYKYKSASEGILLDFVYQNEGRTCVVVLDEIEKAHMEVIHQFLQILEFGKAESVFVKSAKLAAESKGASVPRKILERSSEVDFRNVYLVFTTNAGRSLYENGRQPSPDMTKDVIIDGIRQDINPATGEPYFPDAILSRLQAGNVMLFRHLSSNELVKLGRLILEKDAGMLRKKYGISIGVDPRIPLLMLLREGGQVDARNFRKISENFLRDQVIALAGSMRDGLAGITELLVGVEPEEEENLRELLYQGQAEQEVIFVCENEKRLNLFGRMLKGLEGIRIHKTTDYDEALAMVKKEIFSAPLVFVVMPAVDMVESLTMAAVDNALKTKGLKQFSDFIEDVKKFNERAELCVIDLEHSSRDTKREIMLKGANEILTFARSSDVAQLIQRKVDDLRLNSMAFDFARKGKALKYEIAPAAEGDEIHLRFRFFEKIGNVKSGDDEYLMDENRMPDVSFADIVGGDIIKAEAADFIDFLRDPRSFLEKGLRAPKGLLLHGPAGTGKTFMAKAIAHEAGVPFIATNGGDIKMGRDGINGAELLKKNFSIARKYAPAILFIDEMETIALNRTGADPYADTLVNTLLSEMDGFEGHDSNPVIVIGATNAGISREEHVDGRYLDPAVVRRFTRKFFVDLPLKDDRLTYLERNTGLGREELETAAQMSQGLSFGKMKNAVEIAKRLAVRERRALTQGDVENAVETENFGDVRDRSAESKERTAYHEAGHACIGCILGGSYVPDHATIISRGNFGGYVSQASDEKGMTYSKEYFENQVRISLAGRCAEIIRYGSEGGLTAGPAMDIQSAYQIILNMICRLGMDEEIGMTYIELPVREGCLPEKVQNRVDRLFEQYYQETMELLLSNKGLFEEIAGALIGRESLSRAELLKITEKYYG